MTSALRVVVNLVLEVGLPFVLRFVNDWRSGKTTVKEAIHARIRHEEKPPQTSDEIEKRFMDKVERELSLPDYTLFSEFRR